jgi:protein SCO1/2
MHVTSTSFNIGSRLAAVFAVAALGVSACGGSSGDTAATLTGAALDPAPQVDLVSLPSLSDPGTDIEFRAEAGGIKVVYFGFTNCPDVCPTTLADLTIALRKLEPAEAARVEVVMVTVDPDRDLDVLDTYVTSFVDDAVAAGTSDAELTAAAGAPFGASWEVRTPAGGPTEVDHTPFLYAVDDAGRLVLTWQFGATSDDMSNDLSTLLNGDDA